MNNTNNILTIDVKQTFSTAFRESYPVSFDLYDADNQKVLYITDDDGGREYSLEIINHATSIIHLKKYEKDVADKDTHHFELLFRNSALTEACLSKIKIKETGWSLKIEKQTDGTVSLYILSLNAIDFASGEKLDLTLQNISAAAGIGARGTRVELRYKINFKGDTAPLLGKCIRHLEIVNQVGKKHIPLHVDFLGSNTVLNDGEAQNSLTLCINNVLKYDPGNPEESNVSFWGKQNSKGEANKEVSRFVISFDTNQEWGLTSSKYMKDIQISSMDKNWKVEIRGLEGESPEWIITPLKDCTLNPESDLHLKIENIVTSLPSGNTNIYVRYENIPGYWDGQFICLIKKSIMTERNGAVGIGLLNSNEKFAVSTMIPIYEEKEVLDFNQKHSTWDWKKSHSKTFVSGKTGQLTKLELVKRSTAVGSGYTLTIKDKSSGNKVIYKSNKYTFDDKPYWKEFKISKSVQVEKGKNYVVEISYSKDFSMGVTNDGQLALKTYVRVKTITGHKKKTCFAISEETGNVGVATNNPKHTLEVNGAAAKPGGGSWSDSSDERLKKNIASIDSAEALKKLVSLTGVHYEWKKPEEHSEGVKAGILAQDLEKVFPEWVGEIDASPEEREFVPEGKVKTVSFPHDYNAYLIEAIKELKKEIEELKERIDKQD